MQLTWRKRLEVDPELNQFKNWPHIELNMLPRSKRRVFLRNQRIIAKVLSGQSLKLTAEEFGVSSSLISQMLKRCLAGEQMMLPPLTRGLIPGNRIIYGTRKKPLSDISTPSGCRGAFKYVLDTVPNLKEHLEGIIISACKREKFGQNLTPKFFHKAFLRFLRDANWPETLYPFDQQSLAYESCRQYLNRRIADLEMPEPRKRREVHTRSLSAVPYQEIQIDSQLLDINVSIHIETNGHVRDFRLSRLTLFLATDVATGCHLAYQLCLTKDPTHLDLLSLLEKIHRCWEPLNLKTPELFYSPGACLPSALGELYQNVSVGMIKLDNALCHMSQTVRNYICNEMGGTLNLGLPAHPKGRHLIEHAFKLLNENIHRFASTTGSSPFDHVKEVKRNCKAPPIITLDALEEVLSVLITHHNVTPLDRFGGLTPLDVMRASMRNLLVPLTFAHISNRANPFLRQKKATVRWLSKDKRNPHIQFEGYRYSGSALNNAELVDREVIVEFDVRDIRSLNIYSLKGENLGTVNAPKSWQAYAHSIHTRKKIRKDTRRLRSLGNDPLSGYFAFLLDNKELPKQATELVRVYREYSGVKDQPIFDAKERVQEIANSSEIITKTKHCSQHIPVWSPKLYGGGHGTI